MPLTWPGRPLSAEELAGQGRGAGDGRGWAGRALEFASVGQGSKGPSLFVEYFCPRPAVLGVTREGTETKRPMVVACGFAVAEILHL